MRSTDHSFDAFLIKKFSTLNNKQIYTFPEVIHICVVETERARRVTHPRVRNMIREELALVKQNGG